MGPDAGKNLRNAAIVLALALVVWLLPGGRSGSATIANALSVIFLGGLCFFAYRMYMEHRMTLLDLAEPQRLTLYGSFALAGFCVVAAGRLWGSGPGTLVWLVIMGLAAYGIYSVARAAREY